MAKKSKALAIRSQAVEVLPGRVAGRDPVLERMIEQKIAEMMGDSQDAIFQPFFQTKAIAHEIRKLQTVPQQHKWTYRFEDYGCLICHAKDVRHASLGMCHNCHSRTGNELKASLKRRKNAEKREAPEAVRDLAELAQQAIAQEARTRCDERDEIRAEQKAEREKVARDRIATTQEKRARLAETLRQATEQGLTWGEMAQRYDPDFLKDPKAATERMRVAVYRLVPQPVREAKIAQRQHEKNARNADVWRQARALHGKGLTWREIAELLDPEGFAVEPKAAMARIISGSRRV
jgi:hypothetical protein